MNLKLERPLCFIDIESTGLDVANDRIIELSILKLYPDGSKDIRTKRLNPTIPIPKESSDIHGITDDDVKELPTFKQISKGVANFIADSDFAGFNSNKFDIPLLAEELIRSGVDFSFDNINFIDVGNIYKINEQRTLSAGYKFYCNKVLVDAHSSESDVLATLEIFEKQLEMYSDIPKTLSELSVYSNYGVINVDLSGKISIDEEGDYVYNFGSKKGVKIKTDTSFAEWMLGRDFTMETKHKLEKILEEIRDNMFKS